MRRGLSPAVPDGGQDDSHAMCLTLLQHRWKLARQLSLFYVLLAVYCGCLIFKRLLQHKVDRKREQVQWMCSIRLRSESYSAHGRYLVREANNVGFIYTTIAHDLMSRRIVIKVNLRFFELIPEAFWIVEHVCTDYRPASALGKVRKRNASMIGISSSATLRYCHTYITITVNTFRKRGRRTVHSHRGDSDSREGHCFWMFG